MIAARAARDPLGPHTPIHARLPRATKKTATARYRAIAPQLVETTTILDEEDPFLA